MILPTKKCDCYYDSYVDNSKKWIKIQDNATLQNIYDTIRQKRIRCIVGKTCELDEDKMVNHFMHEKYGIITLTKENINLQYLNFKERNNTNAVLTVELVFQVQDNAEKEFTMEDIEQFIHNTFRHTYDVDGEFKVNVDYETAPDYFAELRIELFCNVLQTPHNIGFNVRVIE